MDTSYKKNLMSWAEYNFDIVLVDERERLKIMNTPVIMGGNKDLYQSIRSLTLYNYKKIVEVLEIGLSIFRKYNENKLDNNLLIDSENSKRSQNIKRIHRVLREIQGSLAYLNPIDFIRDFYRQERKRKEYIGRQSATLLGLCTAYDLLIMDFSLSSGDKSVVESLEKSLSNEIALLYYLNLINPIFYPINEGYLSVHEEIMFQMIEMSSKSNYRDLEVHSGVRVLYSPKPRLVSILKQDNEIRKWFFSIMDDIVRYQKETSKSISHIYNEVNQIDAGVQV
jgi:hypothetical protein